MNQGRKTILRILLTVLLVGAGVLVMTVPSIIRTRRLPFVDINPFAPLVDSGAVPADSLPVDSSRIMAALAKVNDPGVELSIVEMGLIHSIAVDSLRNISVIMTLTTPACPYIRYIGEQALAALKTIPGAAEVRLRIDPMIPWNPARLAGEARKRYERLFSNDSLNSR